MVDIDSAIENEKRLGDRWEKGIPHHDESMRIMRFLSEIDYQLYGDHFCWETGGDGDNGETLMYQLDAYFEARDRHGTSPTPARI